jgi:hypothetical protein
LRLKEQAEGVSKPLAALCRSAFVEVSHSRFKVGLRSEAGETDVTHGPRGPGHTLRPGQLEPLSSGEELRRLSCNNPLFLLDSSPRSERAALIGACADLLERESGPCRQLLIKTGHCVEVAEPTNRLFRCAGSFRSSRADPGPHTLQTPQGVTYPTAIAPAAKELLTGTDRQVRARYCW